MLFEGALGLRGDPVDSLEGPAEELPPLNQNAAGEAHLAPCTTANHTRHELPHINWESQLAKP